MVRRVGCVAGIGCVAVIPSAGRHREDEVPRQNVFSPPAVSRSAPAGLCSSATRTRPGLSSLRELECRAGEPVDGECAGNPGGAKFPIDDWIALVYNRCRSRAALATISLVK